MWWWLWIWRHADVWRRLDNQWSECWISTDCCWWWERYLSIGVDDRELPRLMMMMTMYALCTMWLHAATTTEWHISPSYTLTKYSRGKTKKCDVSKVSKSCKLLRHRKSPYIKLFNLFVLRKTSILNITKIKSFFAQVLRNNATLKQQWKQWCSVSVYYSHIIHDQPCYSR